MTPLPDSMPLRGEDAFGDDDPDRICDKVLLQQIRAGQSEAWEILINRYERLVYSVARRNGLSAMDAMDVTQNTFAILLESYTTLRSEEGLAWWLMTVARRQAWRARHRARREVPVAEVAPVYEEPDIDWEQAFSVHMALDLLDDACRELLIALYFDPREPTYADIAQQMGRAIGGIGPMRARCLARLRTLLEDPQWK